MAKDGFKVLDSDIHIVEPADLWQRYMDPEFSARGPRGLTETIANLYMVGPDGRPWGRNRSPDQDKAMDAGREYSVTEQRFAEFERRGWTSLVQLEAMDAEGIDAAVIFPSRGLYALSDPDIDPPLAGAVARAYNDWLHDFCRADPSRLIGAGMLSPFDVKDAVAEARRAVTELGFRAVFLRPNVVGGRNWYDPYYAPLWSALEDLHVPLGFHEGVASRLPQVGEIFGDNFMLQHVFSHPGEMMLATAAFCAGGVLERHPGLTVAFLEGNCSWAPFLLWRLDEHWERQGDIYAPGLVMPPSHYFLRQCYVSVEADEEPVKGVIDYMGSDRLVFSTDFPHPDSRWPDSVGRFLELPISAEDKRKILWENCARLYDLD